MQRFELVKSNLDIRSAKQRDYNGVCAEQQQNEVNSEATQQLFLRCFKKKKKKQICVLSAEGIMKCTTSEATFFFPLKTTTSTSKRRRLKARDVTLFSCFFSLSLPYAVRCVAMKTAWPLFIVGVLYDAK
jgi:hypothetical protein